MPFGINTPSLFGVVFGVLGPTMLLTKNPILAWKVGMGVTVAMGLAKLLLAFAGDRARRVVPRAALLGSIAGVAILLIAFLPALKVFSDPLVGLTAFIIVLVTLVGRSRLPWGIPGAFAAVVAGSLIFWGREWLGWGITGGTPVGVMAGLRLALPWPTLI
jgi:AGZA family xanthine/uracil permease-like MFS transporter